MGMLYLYNVILGQPFVNGSPYAIGPLSCSVGLSVCLSVCLSLCNGGVVWPNGWTDQDETWHAVRPRPRPVPHCVRWGPSYPKSGRQTAGWIKMPLSTEVGLGPGFILLDGDPAPPKREQSPNFRTMSVVAKRLDGLRYHLVWR